jgi:long-chain acyl-CoA synthetase
LATASFQSFAEMFLHRVASTPDADAFYYPDASEQWITLKWSQVGEQVSRIAGGLHALGVLAEQRCAIMSNTRYDWVAIDIGILCAACATTTIYPNSKAEDFEHIINDSQAQVVFVETDAHVRDLLGSREKMPGLKKIVVINGKATADGFVTTLTELEEVGKKWNANNAGEYEKRARAVRSESLATLIYTSGTTGKPKGVELTHDCWVFEAEAMDGLGFLTPADKQFLWLPLAHSFGKVLEAAVVRIGIPTAIDGRIDRIVENLGKVQPTFVAAVPRIFEKVYNKVVSGAKAGGGMKYKIFQWAVATGREGSVLRQAGREPSGLLSIKLKLADKLVFHKIKTLFGGRLRFFISGSAALNREIAEFFHSLGILILEGYGLTETSAASYVNRPDKLKFGSVGVPLPGVLSKLDPADGEILLGGRGIMKGYHNLPEATAECLTPDGWLRTGDIGTVDADGFLRITDRKKDLIKTSGGKYVAPQEIEGRLKKSNPLISQALVHGNNRNFCVVLITLDEEAAKNWAKANNKGELSPEAIAKDPDMNALIKASVDELNGSLARYESLKYFSILERDFTSDNGFLTPSMKLKRKFVESTYKALLDGFYVGAKEES